MLVRFRRLIARRRLGRLDKASAELAYWRSRRKEEHGLANDHYEWFYTAIFGLTKEDYASRRILDIGCGPRGSLEWADGASERVGLDPLVGSYRDLGIDDHAMTYVEACAEDIPFGTGHFDVVTVFNALDHVDDVDHAIAEITRVTRAGGMALIVVEVNHAPTVTEPQTLGWDLLERFAGWTVVDQERLAIEREHNIYAAVRRAVPWTTGAGLLVARLERARD